MLHMSKTRFSEFLWFFIKYQFFFFSPFFGINSFSFLLQSTLKILLVGADIKHVLRTVAEALDFKGMHSNMFLGHFVGPTER